MKNNNGDILAALASLLCVLMMLIAMLSSVSVDEATMQTPESAATLETAQTPEFATTSETAQTPESAATLETAQTPESAATLETAQTPEPATALEIAQTYEPTESLESVATSETAQIHKSDTVLDVAQTPEPSRTDKTVTSSETEQSTISSSSNEIELSYVDGSYFTQAKLYSDVGARLPFDGYSYIFDSDSESKLLFIDSERKDDSMKVKKVTLTLIGNNLTDIRNKKLDTFIYQSEDAQVFSKEFDTTMYDNETIACFVVDNLHDGCIYQIALTLEDTVSEEEVVYWGILVF